MGVQRKLSSAYHPQTDGQTERVNQCLEMYLRCVVGHKPSQWSNWLPLAELWYNTCHHSALGMSPFQALYNQEPPSINYQQSRATNLVVKKFVQDRTQLLQLIKENLTRAQERMARYANKKRTERYFNEGDEVFLKLQPYWQGIVVMRRNQKLAAKYYGPYQVIKRVGNAAYQLNLSTGAKVHKVFHVSQSKKRIGTGKVVNRGQALTKRVNSEWSLKL